MSPVRLLVVTCCACAAERTIPTEAADDTAPPADTHESGPPPHTGTPPDTGVPDETGHTDDSGDSGDTGTTGDRTPEPCTAWGAPEQTGVLVDEELDEVSGVAPSRTNPGVLWVHEDHGGPTTLTALDVSGVTLGTLTLTGVENVDWEAMALAPCGESDCLWIADAGDNAHARTDSALLRVSEPLVVEGLEVEAEPEVFPIAYPDGAAHNVEAFALLPDGRALFVTKRFDHLADVLVLAREDEIAAHVTTFTTGETPEDDAADAVTSVDVWPDGSRLLLRTYGAVAELDISEVGLSGLGEAERTSLPLSPVPHVEAIAYDAVRRGYWQIAEGVGAPIDFVPCLD